MDESKTRRFFKKASSFLLSFLRNNKTLLIIAVVIAILGWQGDKLTDLIDIKIVYTMRMVGVFAIAAVGLNLLMGYAGQVSLGQGAFFGIGAYTSALLSVKAGFPVWLGIIIAVVFAALAGLLVAPVLRLRGHYLAMATLGLGLTAWVFFRELVWLTDGNVGILNIPKLSLPWLDVSTRRGEYILVWIVALIVLALCSNLVRSRVGRSIKALHQSEVAAAAMGVNVARQKIKIFILSAALAGLAGAIFAHLQGYINPGSFDIFLSIELVIMVVVGGMESIWGAVAGSALIVFLPEFIKTVPGWLGDVPRWVERYSLYEGLIFGLILILTMIFMPKGITKGLSDMVRYRRSPFVNPFKRKVVE